MLDGLRNFAKTVPGKILGAFLLVGVAGFGINNVILDLGSNTVARVGDQEISSRTFQREYSRELSRFGAQFGAVPTGQEAVNLGLPTAVLQRLSQDAALDGLAAQFGLGVTEAKLGQMLRADPSFAGTLGTFNAEIFQQVLRASGLTEAEYFAMQTRAANREQLVAALFGDPWMSEAASNLLGRFIADTRTVDYVVVGPESVLPPDEPTEAELASYLADNQAAFRTAETRSVDVLSFSLAALAATVEVDEAAIAAEYERIRTSLVTPERRTIEQVVLADEAQVALFEQGLAEGRGFAELVAEAGLRPTVLGTRARNELTDANLANAAFGLEEGGFAVIPGVAGRRAIHVSAIEPAGETAFEEARERIVASLAAAEARNDYLEILDQIEELRAAFQPLPDIAARFGLEVHNVPLTRSGAELAVVEDLPASERARVAQAVFVAEQGRLTPAVRIDNSHHVFFEIESVEPVRDQALDEVREAVRQAWIDEQTRLAVAAQVSEIVARLDEGASLADIAFSYNQIPQQSGAFTRNGETDTPIDQAVANAVFAGGPGHHGSAINLDGEQVVFEVTGVDVAEGGLDPATRQALAGEAQLSLFGDFVSGVRDAAGLRINQQALDQVLALTAGN